MGSARLTRIWQALHLSNGEFIRKLLPDEVACKQTQNLSGEWFALTRAVFYLDLGLLISFESELKDNRTSCLLKKKICNQIE